MVNNFYAVISKNIFMTFSINLYRYVKNALEE